MSAAAPVHEEEIAAAVLQRRVRERRLRLACEDDPKELARHVECVDGKTGDRFEFQFDDPETGWGWQRTLLGKWLASALSICLKARQIGITWLACLLALWHLLFRPGSRVLAVSINEPEATKLVGRVWDMYLSLPEHFRSGSTVLKPARGHRPSEGTIEIQHPDGRVSTMLALASTPAAGHGETAALVILDEFSRHKYARETWKAVFATAEGGGRIVVISTGNGISSDANGEVAGNFFHHLWTMADDYKLRKDFLRYDLHPNRDEPWWETKASSLPQRDRAEQYPRNEHEAFILTGNIWYDAEALEWYAANATLQPLYRMQFVSGSGPDKARRERMELGWLSVFKEPETGHKYAVAADAATGRGDDYSAAYVVDLADRSLCAEFHARIDADQYAYQLHFLGRWYNTALIAPELGGGMGGGYGDPIVIFLKDGKDGRPPYPNLYQHRLRNRPDQPIRTRWGFPINTDTRPLILSELGRALREHSLPWLTPRLLHELQTFVNRSNHPSPRAQEGCNDDCVMGAAGACELYRQFGAHIERPRKPRKPKKTAYPWQEPLGDADEINDTTRYPKE